MKRDGIIWKPYINPLTRHMQLVVFNRETGTRYVWDVTRQNIDI